MPSGNRPRHCRVAASPYPAYKTQSMNRRPDKRSAIRHFSAVRPQASGAIPPGPISDCSNHG
ncbi:hypothetical protein C3Z09_11360 [Lelliottia aquatilis]|nr:hypothetical protein C3Z09_11360 [Lelliottia aquatilis]